MTFYLVRADVMGIVSSDKRDFEFFGQTKEVWFDYSFSISSP